MREETKLSNPHVQCQCWGHCLMNRVWTVLLLVQPWLASKATTSTRCGTPWARTCSTRWRRTTVWIGSAAGPWGPSASTSSTTSARRSSPSPGRSSACPASSPVVYKRWAEPAWAQLFNRTMWIHISPDLPHSWRCRLPPGTPWATSYSSGTLSPRNSLWPTNTTSLSWRSTGPSADGAACQTSTSRWVHPNAQIYKILAPTPCSDLGNVFPIAARLVGPVALGALCVGQCGHCSTAQLALLNCGVGGFGSAVQTFHEGHSTGDWNIRFPYCCFKVIIGDTKTAFSMPAGKEMKENRITAGSMSSAPLRWAVIWHCQRDLSPLSRQILTMDEVSKIGKISKQWSGLLREAFTDTDNFGIQFPMDLDVKMKAVMIGACFLIVSEAFHRGRKFCFIYC